MHDFLSVMIRVSFLIFQSEIHLDTIISCMQFEAIVGHLSFLHKIPICIILKTTDSARHQ